MIGIPQNDYQSMLSQALMQQGSSTVPVYSPMQGMGQLAEALAGAYLKKKHNTALPQLQQTMLPNMPMLPYVQGPQP